MDLWLLTPGGLNEQPWSVDQVFLYKVRYQIFVRNQEEKDLLLGYSLMYGRDVQVDILSEWVERHGPKTRHIGGQEFTFAGTESPLPITFTSIYDPKLRELY